MTISTNDRRRLAAEVDIDRRTVDKWNADASKVLPAVAYALRAAAVVLDIDTTESD